MLADMEKRLEKFEDAEERKRLLERLAEIVTDEDHDALSGLSAALAAPGVQPKVVGDDDALTLDIPEKPIVNAQAARARNLLGVLLDRARLRDESYASADVQKILGVSRQRLRQLRQSGKLLAISEGKRRSALYPYWQFSSNEGSGEGSGPDAEPGAPLLHGVDQITAAAREADMSGYVLHFWMVEPKEGLGGKTPAELLAEGDIEAVRRLLAASHPEGF